ncbi:phytoene desaturase family protein [Kocuria sabuli]|uniref:phytoene desaturase family protein n=1 Tax=Kocuria sabuli TaxID=3071448 RepID=UPI0034D39824
METYDAVVIGSGINGLVAAAELGLAGWSVAVIERNQRIGGFIDSAERTRQGFVHDTYSSWHPLFISSDAYRVLGESLRSYGLKYRNVDDGPLTGSIASNHASIAYRSPERTADGFASPRNSVAYLAMLEQMSNRAKTVFGALGSELRSLRGAKLLPEALLSHGPAGVEMLARDAVTSGRSFLRSRFDGQEVDQLWAPWLLHAGLSPDSASGGLMIPVLALLLHSHGLPVVAGGADNFIAAFTGLLDELGVVVMTGRTAKSIRVAEGELTEVRTDADPVGARRAVLASVTPQALYGTLLKGIPVPRQIRTDAARFRYGRAAMQIHVALDRPLKWADARFQDVPLVHLSDGSPSTGVACAQADAGMLPAVPTVVVGRQHLLDPTRVPDGKGSLWLQLQEVPWRPEADAAGKIPVNGTWSPATTTAYVDRVLDRIDAFAPGTKQNVLKTDAITPVDLAKANPNAVNGDPYGGSTELDQSWLWRPLASAGNHATVVPSVWHIGASTHPGAGLGGGSGHIVAQTLIASRQRRSLF